MKAYKHLIKHSLARGCVLSVWDGEEFAQRRSASFTAIVEAVESVEEAQLLIFKDGVKMGWALVHPYGVADDETVSDYTCTPFMNEWEAIISHCEM